MLGSMKLKQNLLSPGMFGEGGGSSSSSSANAGGPDLTVQLSRMIGKGDMQGAHELLGSDSQLLKGMNKHHMRQLMHSEQGQKVSELLKHMTEKEKDEPPPSIE